MADFEATFGKLSWNADQWAVALDEYVAKRPKEDKQALALSKTIKKIMGLLKSNLRSAIAEPAGGHGAGEFDIPALRNPLLRVFSNDKIIQIANGYVDLEQGAIALAGDWTDWAAGIEAAREALGLGGGDFSLAQRAAFWRDFIYGPARIGMDENLYAGDEKKEKKAKQKLSKAKKRYKATIEARLAKWTEDGGAPYWLVLEHGNHESNLAFPRFKGTNFLKKTRKTAQRIYDESLLDIRTQEENIVFREVDRFLDNPEDYKPYDILATFYDEGKKYRVYVTKMMRIGVALRVRRGR